MEVHIYSVKAQGQAGNIWAKDIMAKARDCKNLCILLGNSAEGLGSKTVLLGLHTYLWEYTQKVAASPSLKVATTLLNSSRKDTAGA